VVFLGLGPITPTLQAILKQLHSVSINCVMNPSDAVDLESPPNCLLHSFHLSKSRFLNLWATEKFLMGLGFALLEVNMFCKMIL